MKAASALEALPMNWGRTLGIADMHAAIVNNNRIHLSVGDESALIERGATIMNATIQKSVAGT